MASSNKGSDRGVGREAADQRVAQADPLMDEQASGLGITGKAEPETIQGRDDLPLDAAGERRPWQEPVQIAPEEETPDRGWAGGEATGMSGGAMPEAAGQANQPGTDTDLTLPKVKKRIRVDRA